VGLSVCIITRNEEDDLPRCLASVLGLATQIVVVDSHSTDRTVEIARAAGAEVIARDFSGMASQKAFALTHAREDWVLNLDADEWLDDELRTAIADVVSGVAGGNLVGHELNRRNEYLGAWIEHCGWSPEWRLRLVRRGHGRFEGRDPHDRLVADGPVGRLAGRMCHRPYASLAEHVQKVNSYTDTMAAQRFAAGESATFGRLLLRPPARFLRMYLWQSGWRDGWRGLVVSGMGAFYVFLRYAKLRAADRPAGKGGGGPAGGVSTGD